MVSLTTIIIIFITISILALAYWLWALITSIRKTYTNKTFWIVLNVFLPIIANTAFYFLVYRNLEKTSEEQD